MTETTLFEEAKAFFDKQYPLILFADVEEETEIEVSLIYDYRDEVELIADFGKADDFTSFDDWTGEIVIEPESDHVGTYELKLILTDGYEDYEKTMYLSVVGENSEEESFYTYTEYTENISEEYSSESEAHLYEEGEEIREEGEEGEEIEREEEHYDEEHGEYEEGREGEYEEGEHGEYEERESGNYGEYGEYGEYERGEDGEEEFFNLEEVSQFILEREDGECDEFCLQGRVQELAEVELERAMENIVLEETIEIEGLEITLDLEGLTEHREEKHEGF